MPLPGKAIIILFVTKDEIKQKDIDLYKKELEKCDQAFNKEAKGRRDNRGNAEE